MPGMIFLWPPERRGEDSFTAASKANPGIVRSSRGRTAHSSRM